MSLKKLCAYCGKSSDKRDKEHVIPKCLYPPSKANSKVQRLTVPACKTCNNSWADDEAHFRNMLVIAGDPPTPERNELWNTTMKRSLDLGDGIRRIRDLQLQIMPVLVTGESRYIVFPGNDPRVTRVIRKIVRGLSYFHGLNWPVPDEQVWADVLKYELPENLLAEAKYNHRDTDIVEYWFQVLNQDDIYSAWVLRFFRLIRFIAVVAPTQRQTSLA